jgi:alanyl-tRNA synthetase
MKDLEYKIYHLNFSQKTNYINDLDIKNLGILADELKELYKNKFFCVFSNIVSSRPVIVFACTPDLNEKGIDCSKIAREASRIIKGGGGGRPEFAQAGGTDSSKIKDASELALKIVRELLGLKK